MKKHRIDQKASMEFGLYSLGDHILNSLDGAKNASNKLLKTTLSARIIRFTAIFSTN